MTPTLFLFICSFENGPFDFYVIAPNAEKAVNTAESATGHADNVVRVLRTDCVELAGDTPVWIHQDLYAATLEGSTAHYATSGGIKDVILRFPDSAEIRLIKKNVRIAS